MSDSIFWTDPPSYSGVFWTGSSPWGQPFWVSSPNWLYAPVGAGTGSFSTSSGNYLVSGTGLGVAGNADSLYFAYQLAAGNLELITQVTTQTGTSAYAISGLMISDLSGSSPQCALVSVSPQNGVNFSYRTADGGTASTTLGPSLATPIWLRLVVSQTSVAGFESSDGISWNLVGQCTMTLPATYNAGFAVANNNVAPSNQATFPEPDFNYILNPPQRSANLLTWLRADVGISYSGTSISQWADESANGYVATQPSTSNQPTVVQWGGGSAPTGSSAILFTNSASQFFQLPAYPNFTSGATIFAVLQPLALTANSTILDLSNQSGSTKNNNLGLSINSSGGAQFYVYNGSTGSFVGSSNSLSTSQYQLIDVLYDGVQNADLYMNQVFQAGSGSMKPTPTWTTPQYDFIGQVNSANYFDGNIAEILIYSTALSEINRQLVETYLLSKYSV